MKIQLCDLRPIKYCKDGSEIKYTQNDIGAR